jgi:hypothetical protein
MAVRRWVWWPKAAALAAWLAAHAGLWPLLPPVPLWTLQGSIIRGLSFTPDGRSLVTDDYETIRVWDAASGQLRCSWPRPADPSRRVGLSTTDRWAIAYGYDFVPHLIELDTGRLVRLPPYFCDEAGRQPLQGESLAITPDGQTALQSVFFPDRNTHAVRLWNIGSGEEQLIPIDTQRGRFAISNEGRIAVTFRWADPPPGADRQLFVHIIDLADLSSRSFPVTMNFLPRLPDLAPDGRCLAVCGMIRGPRGLSMVSQVWDVETCRLLTSVKDAFTVGWNADNQLILQSVSGSELWVIDGRTGQELARWACPGPIVTFQGLSDAKLDPTRRALVLGVHQHLPELVQGLLARLPQRPIDPAQYWPMFLVLDARTGQRLGAVDAEPGCEAVALAAGGRALAILDRNGGVRVWSFPPRRPGGIVLALMIAEVGLLTAWTAWRRARRRRPRPAVA